VPSELLCEVCCMCSLRQSVLCVNVRARFDIRCVRVLVFCFQHVFVLCGWLWVRVRAFVCLFLPVLVWATHFPWVLLLGLVILGHRDRLAPLFCGVACGASCLPCCKFPRVLVVFRLCVRQGRVGVRNPFHTSNSDSRRFHQALLRTFLGGGWSYRRIYM